MAGSGLEAAPESRAGHYSMGGRVKFYDIFSISSSSPPDGVTGWIKFSLQMVSLKLPLQNFKSEYYLLLHPWGRRSYYARYRF